MKKILSKFLLFILGIVVAVCALIVACAMDKGIAKSVSDVVNSLNLHIEINKSEEEELASADSTQETVGTAGNDSSGTSDASANASSEDVTEIMDLADAATAVSSVTYTQTKEKEYSEYLGDWTTSGIDRDVVDGTIAEDEPLVNEDINEVDENGNPVTYYDNIDEMVDYSLPTRDVIELEDQEKVSEALKDIGMGYQGNGYDFDKDFYPYYHMLNDKCKALYRQIYANALNEWPEFLPVQVATPDEWNNALLSVSYDHPELFWLDTRIYTEYDYKGKVVKVRIYFYEELGDIAAAREIFNSYTENALSVARAMETVEDKERFVHDYLAERLTYKANDLDQSAYSALVQNETVCAGYAKGFQYLMQQLEIPTYFCVGWGGGLVSGGMHGWDIIKLDKKYANVDVTWDDKNPTIYEFYNRKDSDFHRHKRMFNSQYLPACN